jgi:hypothetical protein
VACTTARRSAAARRIPHFSGAWYNPGAWGAGSEAAEKEAAMTVEERLENLERELAKSKRQNLRLAIGGAVVMTCVVIFLAAWARPTDVRARSFIVADENGTERAALAVDKHGPALRLLDKKGNLRVVLAVDKDGPGLDLFDEKDNLNVVLGANKDGAVLALADEDGKAGASLVAIKEGAGVRLSDKDGKTRARLSTNNKNGPGLDLFDENGNLRAVLAVDKGGPGLDLFDENDKVTWKTSQ